MPIRGLTQLGLLCGISALLAIFLYGWEASKTRSLAPHSGGILPEDVRRLPPGTLLFVDCRKRPEYSRGHAPGALQLNNEEWNVLIPAFYDAWKPGAVVIVYGKANTDESKAIAYRLKSESGIQDIYFLEGIWEECG